MRRRHEVSPGVAVRYAGHPDSGFSLIEVLVALGLVVLAGTFAVQVLVMSLSTVREHANREVATQMAAELTNRARAYGGTTLLADHQSLPAADKTRTVSDIPFERDWSVQPCRQPHPGGPCTTAPPGPGVAELVLVTVTVQWPGRGTAQPVTATALVDLASSEPVFRR